MNSRRFNDPIAFDPLPARAGLQDIELARISQEVKKRFYQGLGLQPRNRAFIHLIGRYQKHWLARAEEARILANQMTDAEAKVAMLRIAEDYERLAQRAEGRALGRHELAAPHSITSSARTRTESGIVNPIAFAVLRLRTMSNFVACSTGRSAGFAPLKILSTKYAARRYIEGRFSP